MHIDHAIQLLGYGFSMIPVHKPVGKGCSCKNIHCQSTGKHPVPTKWQEITSKDPTSIKAWWRAFKDPNAGVVTGKVSGVVILDIDPRHGGMDTLDDLQVKHGKLPNTATVETGGGGYHYYFKSPDQSIKNATNVGGSGVDFRGDGGFVVSPGSEHSSGKTYDWYDGQTPNEAGFANLPGWLFDLVYKPPVKVAQMKAGDVRVAEGGRNVFLTGLAGAIRNRGCGYKTILAALVEANIENCIPPLFDEEVMLIARSISKYAITGREML